MLWVSHKHIQCCNLLRATNGAQGHLVHTRPAKHVATRHDGAVLLHRAAHSAQAGVSPSWSHPGTCHLAGWYRPGDGRRREPRGPAWVRRQCGRRDPCTSSMPTYHTSCCCRTCGNPQPSSDSAVSRGIGMGMNRGRQAGGRGRGRRGGRGAWRVQGAVTVRQWRQHWLLKQGGATSSAHSAVSTDRVSTDRHGPQAPS